MKAPPEGRRNRMNYRISNLIFAAVSVLAVGFLLFAAAQLVSGDLIPFLSGAGGTGLFAAGLLICAGAIAGINYLQFRMRRDAAAANEITAGLARGESPKFDADGELLENLRAISNFLNEKTDVMVRLAAGEISAYSIPRSEYDRMGTALYRIAEKLESAQGSSAARDRLRNSVLRLLDEVSGVAAGDLTVTADPHSEETGEIADAFNRMTGNFRSLISQVKDAAARVSAAADTINDTTEQLAHGSSAQSSQISRTASSASGITAKIREICEKGAIAVRIAGESLQNAKFGNAAARDNTEAMNSIRRQVQETAKRVKKLGERSQEIGQIVNLIDDLSDRTSLLALNASLRASRGTGAGDFGKVTEEIERLAERTANLTQQIAALTQTMNFETKEVVSSMEEAIREVIVGSALAEKAGKSLVDIERTSNKLAEILNAIAESAKQQAENSEEISKSMAEISEVTELVQNGSKRAAESMKTLVRLSGELKNSVAPFKLPVETAVIPPASADSGVFLN